MCKIIAVINQKGGVGKTTTSINLASGLGYLKHKTLLIDFDPQGNASNGLGLYIDEKSPTILDAFFTNDLSNCKYQTKNKYLDIVPSNIFLSKVELGTIELKDRTYMLKKLLDKERANYEYIIIDCPPALSILSQAALTAADSVFIPIQCEYFALEGATQLLKSIRDVQKTTNTHIKIEGVIITMVDLRTTLSAEIQEEVRRHFKGKMYDTFIPRNVELSKATAFGQSIFEYNCNSEGSKAYASMIKEFLSRQGSFNVKTH